MNESTGFYAISQLWLVGALLSSCTQITYFMGFMAAIWFIGAVLLQVIEDK